MMETKCAICGEKIAMDDVQIIFATKYRGAESVCIKCGYSPELKKYIDCYGGVVSIREAINGGCK